MIASLPMYTSTPATVQALWGYLSAHLRGAGLRNVPDTLTWPLEMLGHWRNPSLLLSQACGYPLVTELHNQVRVIGTFRYGVPGCQGGFCRSAMVVRHDEHASELSQFRDRRVAYNSLDSQSGYNSLRALVAPLAVSGKFFGQTVEAGAHRRSIEMVRDGFADIASIDCVSLAGFEKYLPDITRGTRVIGYSDPYPGLPLIAAAGISDSTLATLRLILSKAMQDSTLAVIRRDLFIEGFEPLELADYQICSDMRDHANQLNCYHL
jgi:ABC-type phosphate/phosphonate transport system substrate-binding protein